MIDLVYILSPGHSGSTLLGLLLGAHPAIATVGELKDVPRSYRGDESCSCGELMRKCAFWSVIARRLAESGHDLGGPGFWTHMSPRRTVWDALLDAQVRGRAGELPRRILLATVSAGRRHLLRTLTHNELLIRIILDVTGRDVFLDTSKNASRLHYLLDSGRFALKVIHLVRDGRAVAYSLVRKGVDPVTASAEWLSEHRQAGHLRPCVEPRNWLQIRYEDLCADPEATLARMFAFAGVAPQPTVDFRSWDHHVIGNRMRLGATTRIELDLAWQRELKGTALQAVQNVVSEMNRQYEYE